MKKINELTDQEIQERINILSEMDTRSTGRLISELKEELEARAEKKRLEEKNRLAEQKKQELARVQEDGKKEVELVKKQSQLIGAYYEIDGVAYKVVGVYNDNVILEHKKVYKYGNSTSSNKSVITRSIDYVLEHGDRITKQEYLDSKPKVQEITNPFDNFLSFDSLFKPLSLFF